MRYWWVNQNQTYVHEVGGGYLWSPKVNANGKSNRHELMESEEMYFWQKFYSQFPHLHAIVLMTALLLNPAIVMAT